MLHKRNTALVTNNRTDNCLLWTWIL